MVRDLRAIHAHLLPSELPGDRRARTEPRFRLVARCGPGQGVSRLQTVSSRRRAGLARMEHASRRCGPRRPTHRRWRGRPRRHRRARGPARVQPATSAPRRARRARRPAGSDRPRPAGIHSAATAGTDRSADLVGGVRRRVRERAPVQRDDQGDLRRDTDAAPRPTRFVRRWSLDDHRRPRVPSAVRRRRVARSSGAEMHRRRRGGLRRVVCPLAPATARTGRGAAHAGRRPGDRRAEVERPARSRAGGAAMPPDRRPRRRPVGRRRDARCGSAARTARRGHAGAACARRRRRGRGGDQGGARPTGEPARGADRVVAACRPTRRPAPAGVCVRRRRAGLSVA